MHSDVREMEPIAAGPRLAQRNSIW